LTRNHRLFRTVAPTAVLALLFAACSAGGSAAPASQGQPSQAPASQGAPESPGESASGGASLDKLIADAKSEGTLTTIALPHDWCNYGEAIDTFKSKYGLQINELDPNAGSGDEVEAIKANKGSTGPQAPDVIDVGLSFGPSAKSEDLLEPYKVATWDSIPDSAKDPDGAWYGDYYGVLSFEVNTGVIPNVPQDWADLLKPEYKGKVAIRWTYNALSNRDTTAASGGPKIEVVVPKSGRFAGVYVQAISKYAPHPNAAKLWMEFLYSDEGQNIWLKGYCHPIRYEDLVKNNKVPQEQLTKLPDVTGAVFPSLDQLNAASKLITTNWDKTVGANIK
jgi:putative spermidine/putrescine transport system substrate-binding protein